MSSTFPKIERWIVSGDYQVPFHDDRALTAFEKFMAAHRWDGYVNLGDFLDFDTISHFNVGNVRSILNRQLSNDFEAANKILDRHQAIVRKRNPKAKFVLLEGNHDFRVETWLDSNPQFEGMLDIPKLLHLQERGFKWVKSWSKGEVYKIGKASFVHGLYTNQYHARKMLDAEAASVFYGHTHDMMCIPRTRRDKADLQVGQSLGCMCEVEQSYMKGKPSNWQQGFGVFHFLPDGTYTYYTPRIIAGRFVGPDGVLYQ
jgi:predicted phosphodiesterase